MTKFKLNQKKKDELACVSYFIPKNYNGFSATDTIKDFKGQVIFINHDEYLYILDKNGYSAEEAYFKITSEGLKKIRLKNFKEVKQLNKLLSGLRWRGIHIHEMWEQGILEGSVPYFTLLGMEKEDKKMPDVVIEYLKKEIFQGQDADLIEAIKNKQFIDLK